MAGSPPQASWPPAPEHWSGSASSGSTPCTWHHPALPGCLSQGRTRREVLRNIREAIEAYVESLLEDGLPVPVERGREMVEVEVAAR
jgi:predicted RNase H-like HicB family nuclease